MTKLRAMQRTTDITDKNAGQHSLKRSFQDYSDLDLARYIPTDSSNATRQDSAHATTSTRSARKRSKQPRCHDATLVLIGFRGSGRSTLGFIASTVLRRRYIDVDHYFREQTGETRSRFIASHGLSKYSNLEGQLMHKLLKENNKNCVIGGIYGIRSGGQQDSLWDLLDKLPVVYIVRNQQDLQLYLNVDTTRFQQIYEPSSTLHRALSDYEFYNWTDDIPRLESANDSRFLRLKKTEQDFTRLLFQIFPKLSKTCSEDSLTRPCIRGELYQRDYTYALQVPFDWLQDPKSNLEELESGADIIEYHVDITKSSNNSIQDEICRHFVVLRRYARVPILLHLHPTSSTDNHTYHEAIKSGLKLAPDYISVDIDRLDEQLEGLTTYLGQTKLVGDCIDKDGDIIRHHDKIIAFVEKTQRVGCCLARVCLNSHVVLNKFECRQFVDSLRKTHSIPVAAYEQGLTGRTSVCFNNLLSPVTLSAMSHSGVRLRDAQNALFASSILQKKKFYILGKDVSFSLSPAMHNAAYQYLGMPHSYQIIQTDTIADIQRLLQHPETGGITISLPFKIDILKYTTVIDKHAQIIGAVNTLLVTSNSPTYDKIPNLQALFPKIEGFNTDYIGIYKCIYRRLSTANTIRPTSTVLIVGSGGMARASVYASMKLGFEHIFILNRTTLNANKMIDHFIDKIDLEKKRCCSFTVLDSSDVPWPENKPLPTVIISTIPAHDVGQTPAPNLTLPETWLLSRTGGVFVELSYKPLDTPLLQQMRTKQDRGWNIVDGLEVLLEQGIAQFELYTGRPAPVHVMHRAIRERYTEATSYPLRVSP